MYELYTNQRISDEERKILHQHPDDYLWYGVIIGKLFDKHQRFEVREDIKLPQKEDDDGVVLIFEDGTVTYFKTSIGIMTDEDYKTMKKVCKYLLKKFKQPIDVYIACSPNSKINFSELPYDYDIKVTYSSIPIKKGDEIIEKLESKVKNHEEFSIMDSIEHMLLPFIGCENQKNFMKKYTQYMKNVKKCSIYY